MANNRVPGSKTGGPISRKALYGKASSHALEAIEVLVDVMRNGDNPSARTGAAKAILNKCIPDLKSTELTGNEQKALVVRILGYGEK